MVLRIKEEREQIQDEGTISRYLIRGKRRTALHTLPVLHSGGRGELGGGLSCESYGVKVAGPDGEEASVPNITVSVERIDQLLELLRRNCVSPVTLRDVVLDWL